MNTRAAVLALLSSLLYGGGDFALGVASRANSVFGTSVVFHALGLPLTAVVLVITRPAVPDAHALGAALLAGACLAAAGLFFVQALAKGRMGVIAPLTAVGAAGVPAVVGMARGESPPPIAVAGMVAAAVGLLLVTTDRSQPLSAGGIPEGIAAAVGFGGFYVCLRAGESGGWWTVGISRAVVLAATVAAALLLRRAVSVPWPNTPVIVVASTLATLAAAAFLFAQHQAALSLTAVLASLYPAVTALLAATLLHERLTRRQLAGSVIVLGAAACIALP